MFGWDYLERIADVWIWLCDPARHFLYSGLVGLLVYSLTSTILFAHGWAWERLTRRRVGSVAVYIMVLLSTLLAISAGLACHYILDYGWAAFTLPLNPPLDLKTIINMFSAVVTII